MADIKQSKIRYADEEDDGTLLVTFESIDTQRPHENEGPEAGWPVFSSDPYSRYSLFATGSRGVTFLSFLPWADRLESELANAGDAGLEMRLQIFAQEFGTHRQRVLEIQSREARQDYLARNLTGSVLFRDSDLGYFLLSEANGQPHAVSFDLPEMEGVQGKEESPARVFEPEIQSSVQKPRALYQPPSSLWTASPLQSFLRDRAQGRLKLSLTEEIKFSQATLILMTEAHKVLSQHTHEMGIAAAELFRRCERLQEEFREQIKRADQVASRIDGVLGEDAEGGNGAVDRRIEAARARQEDLNQRYDRLRRKMGRMGGRKISDKEAGWMAEVEKMRGFVLGEDDSEQAQSSSMLPWRRFQEVIFSLSVMSGRC